MPYLKAILLLFTTSGAVHAATISLNAVKLNGQPIAPTNNLTAAPGDRIEVEVLVLGWLVELPAGLRAWQARIGVEGDPPDDTRGTILSNECDIYCPLPRCGSVLDGCPLPDSVCRPDGCCYTSQTPCNSVRAWGITEEACLPDTGVPRYAGTLTLVVSDDACGRFKVDFLGDGASFCVGCGPDPLLVLPETQPLLVTVSPCTPQLLSCDPPHCMIDARIPFDPYSNVVLLFPFSMYMTFSGPTAGMTASQFEVTVVPFQQGDIVPAISAVTPAGNSATVLLNRRIQQTRWTCIRHIPSDRRCCIGNLPGDADWSRVSEAEDVLVLLDNLTGEVDPPLPLEQCDTDRSLICAPADILMAIDLLNGAGRFDPVNGNGLPVCPSITP